MWIKNVDDGVWYKKSDVLEKDVFDNLKQDLEKVRLYSKCLSGSTYVAINSLNNVYNILDTRDEYNWFIGQSGSTYSISATPSFYKNIDSSTKSEYYDKFTYDYGLTLKNKFTPVKLINDSIDNYVEVDVATTDSILNIGTYQPGLIIDSTLLKDGHRVLIKDQKTFITLSYLISPEQYFNHSYSIEENNTTSIKYSFYNSENGIYKYTNNTLIREVDIDNYKNAHKYSVSVKLGDINTQKQYHLNRLTNGYYPIYLNNDSMEFIEKKNWVLRNRVDYNNIYEISYNDIVRYTTQSYSIDNSLIEIPSRVISVGEFGVIVLYQNGVSNIINNKYKYDLKSLSDTPNYYWVCGNEGTLLKISKLTLDITKVELNEVSNFNSIDFVDDLRGIVVGMFNTIYFTKDGGYNWVNISKEEFEANSYNKVIYQAIDKAYIGGESGVFIQMNYINNQWIFYKRKISKFLNIEEPTEEYLLVDDIRDMHFLSTSNWNLTYSVATQSVISNNKDILFIATNGGNLLLHDVNNFIDNFDFLYFSFTQSKVDINSITTISGSSSIYLSSDKVYKLDLHDFNIIDDKSNNISSTQSTLEYDKFINKLYDYNGENLYLCGNNSTLYYSGYTQSLYEIDSDFNNRYKSKLLFLDYEIGSKLNFFDDSQTYRLPNYLTFSSTDIGNTFILNNKPNENNWISYYKDSEKTFSYYTSLDTINQVEFSTTFSYADTSFSFTSSNINITSDGIKGLAPTIDSYNSRYISGTTSIVGSTYSESIFLYKYLIIFKKDLSYDCSIGDVLYFDSNIISATLVINSIVEINSNKYIYSYIDFDQTIINDLKSVDYNVTITNLNRFTSIDDLVVNFNLHPISNGYKMIGENDIYTLYTEYNNKTAYYNLQSNIITDGGSYNMNYTDSFLKFGYKPTYNIFDYLSNVNSDIFNSNKRFSSMPRYASLPGNSSGTFTPDNIYIDTNNDTNKIIFGSNLKFEWNSIWINTFVDVNLFTGTSSLSSEKMLIMKKYYDKDIDGYVIEFHKKLNYNYGDPIDTIDILSRNTLLDISDDLQIMNNIHRSSSAKSIQLNKSFINLENELTFKISTDSYSKILLSDRDIKLNLSGIVYVDDKNELALNIIKLQEEFDVLISNTGRYMTASTDYLLITCSQSHNLNIDDNINITFSGGSYSSNFLNKNYFGYHIVQGIISDTSFYTYKIFDGVDIPFSDPGNISFIKRDPFLNYQPIDIMDVGIDKQVKRSVEITSENYKLEKSNYNLINIDFNKYRYELVDGLSVIDIYNKYPWILEGEISNAVIGEDVNGLVWYMGDWRCGRWFDGTWMSGRWISGDWYRGIWNSLNTKYKLLTVDVSKSVSNKHSSKWYNGRWFDGTWNNGTWYNGRRYAGVWNDGIWYNGIWNEGTWNNGEFKGGIWVLGTWNNGIFNCDNKPSYWINGSWYGGDFENGMWYNGQFLTKNDTKSRFGTKSFNTRTATWNSGKFTGGEFHSYLNIDDFTGEPIASEFNKYSIWNTGIWNGGDWYGGVAYAINFNSGNWYGGIIEEIQIMGLTIVDGQLSKFILNGQFKFNVNDEIWIVNDNNPTPYGIIGTNEDPGDYKVLLTEVIGDKTIITINKDLFLKTGSINIDNIDTGLRLTTIFKNSNWKSGIWTNGIFDGGYFEGGIWYGGLFKSNWGR